ncbi:conserved membrane hypothetical protein [Rubrivivax sp. A210]|uniref:hypothetical protein n=1 Tax=Rubrivivax sp. A210 TaxID=2772301 RepID=UPI00191A6ECA|nr:hypothetical protein [Rubrivivax sp. A210]CAD5366132.1 conserved membrane hypothetical protein [Rubrivivax sp. A210]
MLLIKTLMRREWLQHRTGWTLLTLVPLALALVLVAFGEVQFDDDDGLTELPLPLVAMAGIAGGTTLVFLTLLTTSAVILSGLPRRDHNDRSIEFWLSLPVGHAHSLAVPLLVHMLLVPAAALAAGALGGLALSLALVARVAGFADWFTLPWGDLLAASLALGMRLLAGVPLAALWLLPLMLLVMLATALFKRWGLVILAVGLGLGGVVLERIFGQPMLADALATLVRGGSQALIGAGGRSLAVPTGSGPSTALQGLPGWAWHDLGAALAALASPTLVGGLLLAVACFAGLVVWRQRGA